MKPTTFLQTASLAILAGLSALVSAALTTGCNPCGYCADMDLSLTDGAYGIADVGAGLTWAQSLEGAVLDGELFSLSYIDLDGQPAEASWSVIAAD